MKKLVALLSFMLVVLFTGQLFAQADNSAVITFKKTEHDYGTIKKGAPNKCSFEFTNTGKEPLFVTDVKSTCGCTIPAWSQEPIMPGQKGTINVEYDTNRVGAIDKSITVFSSAKNAQVILHIKGTITE